MICTKPFSRLRAGAPQPDTPSQEEEKRSSQPPPGTRPLFWLLAGMLALAAMGAMNARAADAEELADFALTIQPTDTLIGISNRLLIEPNRWPELQKHNNIADPRRLVPGSTLLIPRPLLRVDPAEIEVRNVIGQA